MKYVVTSQNFEKLYIFGTILFEFIEALGISGFIKNDSSYVISIHRINASNAQMCAKDGVRNT